MNKIRCDYQRQESNLTLREGIEEYFAANPHLLLSEGMSHDSSEFFESHDRIHVMFGCDTSFAHETRADFWTVFGSDIGVFRYLSAASGSVVRDLYNDLKTKSTDEEKTRIRKDIKTGLLPAALAPFQVYLRARKMTKKWPWSTSADYLDWPLRAIREEFGIRIFES